MAHKSNSGLRNLVKRGQARNAFRNYREMVRNAPTPEAADYWIAKAAEVYAVRNERG